MHKVVIHRRGHYDRLRYEEHPSPSLPAGHVRIAVHACGVNYADCIVRMGLYSSAREYVGWPITPGFEVAGVVADVGDGVDDLKIGDDVLAVTRFGGYADELVVPRHQVWARPAALSAVQAAAMPAVFLTAWYALVHLARPERGDPILVHSAAGGVGQALVQLARARGCKTVGVVGGTHKIESVYALDPSAVVVDKSASKRWWDDVTREAPEGYAAVFDANGVSTLRKSYRHLAPTGTLVIYGFSSMLPKGGKRVSWAVAGGGLPPDAAIRPAAPGAEQPQPDGVQPQLSVRAGRHSREGHGGAAALVCRRDAVAAAGADVRAAGRGGCPSGDRVGHDGGQARADDRALRRGVSAGSESDSGSDGLVVDGELAGKTVSAIIRILRPEVPWSRAKAWCRAGRLTVDGVVERDPAARVSEGASVLLGRPQRDRTGDVPILHVDREIVVVDKPAGLITVPFEARGDDGPRRGGSPRRDEGDNLRARVHEALRRKFGPVPPPRTVQRLDLETSGVLVFARNRRAERALQQQLRTHDVDRRYLALAWGPVPPRRHDTWIVRDRGDRRRGHLPGSSGSRVPGGKRAITRVEPIEYFESFGITLVSCRLETGRQHQIRIHLSESGHPLLGDRVYLGPLGTDRDAWSKDHGERIDALAIDRTMLHAERLGIRHPASEDPMVFCADPPPDFAAVLARLRGG